MVHLVGRVAVLGDWVEMLPEAAEQEHLGKD
jgi:hypothetical protein